MRSTFVSFLVVAICGILGIPINQVQGAEIRTNEIVRIEKDETIKDDLYAFGKEIIIDGTVEGDVIAFGQQITINGRVKGHVMAAGQTVVVTGESGGARIAGQVLKLGPTAKLDGDLLAAGLSLECVKESAVSGDALFAGYQALFAGQVGDDLRGGMANCRLEGLIGGNVNVEVGGDKDAPPVSSFGPPPPVPMPSVPGGLTVAESAEVEGDLTYQSSREARIDPKAHINGEVNFHKPSPKPKAKDAAAPAQNPAVTKTVSRIKHVACVAIVGLVVLLIFPGWSTAVADTIRTRPGATFLSGLIGLAAFVAFLLLTIILVIIAAVFLAGIQLTELVPMVVVGGLVGYAAIIVGFWILAAFLAEAIAGLAVGRMAFRDQNFVPRLMALLLGIVVMGLVLSVPVVGGLVGFVVLLFALGSVCLWFIGQTPSQSFAPLPPQKQVPATVA